MSNWAHFEAESPELAGLLRERFDSTQLVMLGTLRKNGWPRITPIEYTFWDGELVLGGMWQSKKLLDLLRDPRCAIHSTTSDKSGQQGDAKLYGKAFPLSGAREGGYWQHIERETGWRPPGPAHAFTVDVESAAYVRFSAEGNMEWVTWPGNEWRRSKAP